MAWTAKQTRQRRAERIAAGLCSTCGNCPPTSGTTCQNCKAKKTNYYHKRVSAGLCPCGQPTTGQKRCPACSEREQKTHYKLVAEVIAHYGGICACCGDDTPAHLTVDHVDGGGSAHSRKIGRGAALYRWIKRNGFPSGFQILCANCNHGRARNSGICPHIAIVAPAESPHGRSRRQAAREVLAAYGGQCRCGESNPLFLCLDHVNSDGAAHRRQIGTKLLAVWARQHNYPPSLQILCDNCNLSKDRPFLGGLAVRRVVPSEGQNQ